jgi:autophagy-related protein 2
VPSEVTRISIQLDDTSVHVAAPTHPGALVLSLGHLAVSTELVSDATGKTVEIAGSGIRTLLIDDLKAPLPEKGQSHRPLTGPEHWKVSGTLLFLFASGKTESRARDYPATRIRQFSRDLNSNDWSAL